MLQNHLPLPLAVALLAAPALAADIKHEFSATSAADVQVTPDGTVKMHERNVRFVTYVRFDGDHQLARLATVTTDLRRSSDAEGDDPSSTVSVTVDDLTQAAPRRLAAFSDPGSEGVLLGQSYFDTRQPGCCAGPTIHSLRSLEDGKLLYRATGDGITGSAAWASAPNARPAVVRWAAFDGRVDEAALAKGVIGILSYGGPEGALSRVEIRVKGLDAEDLNLGLLHEAKLVWVDTATQKAGHPPAAGSAAYPEDIWSLDKVSAAAKISGFALRLLGYDGKPLATIPIAGDRLNAGRATLAKGVLLTEAPPS